jgi:hypothetical protein
MEISNVSENVRLIHRSVCAGFAFNICMRFEWFEQNCIAGINLIKRCYFVTIFYFRAGIGMV